MALFFFYFIKIDGCQGVLFRNSGRRTAVITIFKVDFVENSLELLLLTNFNPEILLAGFLTAMLWLPFILQHFVAH